MAYYAWLQRIYGNHNIHWPLASVFSDVCAVSARLLCLCCVYLCWFSFWFFLLKIVENNWKTQNVALWMLIWLNVCDARIFILEVYVNNMDVSRRAKFEYHSSLNSEKSTPTDFQSQISQISTPFGVESTPMVTTYCEWFYWRDSSLCCFSSDGCVLGMILWIW